MTKGKFEKKIKAMFQTQAKAATALGITQQAVSNFCTGRREVPLWLVKFLECLERGLKPDSGHLSKGGTGKMTRQMICLKCAERRPGDYPGEWWVRIQGKARGFKNGDFVCDLCNTTIPKGTDCVAQSFGLDRQPYEPWEGEYLGNNPGVVDGTILVITREDDGSTKIEEIEPK
jgi:hypothetical protein